MRGKRRSPWLDPGSLCHRFSDSSFSWVGQDLRRQEPQKHTLCLSPFFRLCHGLCPFFSMYPNLSHHMRPAWTPLHTHKASFDHLWHDGTHLHPCSIYSLHLRLAFSQELPLTCPISPPSIYFRGELTASCSWAFGSGGDLWSIVSRSELNEAPDQEPTPGSPQEFPVKLPPPPLCVPFPALPASPLNHRFPC